MDLNQNTILLGLPIAIEQLAKPNFMLYDD